MSRSSIYKWLIVVEGVTDVKTYDDLLLRYGVALNDLFIVPVSGKGYVCNTSTWNTKTVKGIAGSLENLIINDIGRNDFQGIILIVDSDESNIDVFNAYKRNPKFPYVSITAISPENKGSYWYLDEINGVKNIPIYGINVPVSSSGCLETDLLDSYGFPVDGQDEYVKIVDAIQKASNHWQIQTLGNGKNWWEENQRAKLDKFIYSAFSHGFEVSGVNPSLHNEPDVIQNIKHVIGIL